MGNIWKVEQMNYTQQLCFVVKNRNLFIVACLFVCSAKILPCLMVGKMEEKKLITHLTYYSFTMMTFYCPSSKQRQVETLEMSRLRIHYLNFWNISLVVGMFVNCFCFGRRFGFEGKMTFPFLTCSFIFISTAKKQIQKRRSRRKLWFRILWDIYTQLLLWHLQFHIVSYYLSSLVSSANVNFSQSTCQRHKYDASQITTYFYGFINYHFHQMSLINLLYVEICSNEAYEAPQATSYNCFDMCMKWFWKSNFYWYYFSLMALPFGKKFINGFTRKKIISFDLRF